MSECESEGAGERASQREFSSTHMEEEEEQEEGEELDRGVAFVASSEFEEELSTRQAVQNVSPAKRREERQEELCVTARRVSDRACISSLPSSSCMHC